jgi:hypothetical protein
MSALKVQIPSDYVLVDNAVFAEVTDASTSTKSGTVAENFNYSVSAKASTLAFKKSDLDKFARDYIVSQIPEGKTMVGDPEINYSVGLVDVSKGKAIVNIDFSSGVSQSIDKNSIALSLLGKNDSQISETIKSSLGDGVKVEINFWPFWVKSAPNNQKAVNVVIKFQ